MLLPLIITLLILVDNEDVSVDGYDEALARKEALSNWLAKISRTVIQEEIENIEAKVSATLMAKILI